MSRKNTIIFNTLQYAVCINHRAKKQIPNLMFVLSTAPTNCKLFKEINREKQDLDFKRNYKVPPRPWLQLV
jgi:hypothetical protein